MIFAVRRDLVGIAAQANHLSFFTMSPALAKAMKDKISKTHQVSEQQSTSHLIIRSRRRSWRRSSAPGWRRTPNHSLWAPGVLRRASLPRDALVQGMLR